MPTNGKSDEGKGCPAASSARPAPGRRSRTARAVATPARPERRPRCGSQERPGTGERRLGSQAVFAVFHSQPTGPPPPRLKQTGKPGRMALKLPYGVPGRKGGGNGEETPRVGEKRARKFSEVLVRAGSCPPPPGPAGLSLGLGCPGAARPAGSGRWGGVASRSPGVCPGQSVQRACGSSA